MKSIVIATVLSVFIATPALAAKPKPYYDSYDSRDSYASGKPAKMYIGISGGQHKTDEPTLTTTSTAYSVFAGYNFNDYIGAELAYNNLGKLEVVPGTVDLKSTAASLSLLASAPMGKMAAVYIKGGYASTSTILVTSGVDGTTDTNNGATYGAGLQLNMGHRAAVRLGYDVYKMLSGTTNYNSSVASLGVLFKF